jgi:predicted alpha/beta-fold hydrolase
MDQLGPIACFFFSIYGHTWLQLIGKPLLLHSDPHKGDPHPNVAAVKRTMRDIISKCPTQHTLYVPPLLLWHCDVQLASFVIKSMIVSRWFPPCKWFPQNAELDDGEIIQLDWAQSIPKPDPEDPTPVLIICHGAFCDSSDLPGQLYVANALARGWLVCVANRRGHMRKISKGIFNFFGSTDDLRTIVSKHVKSVRPRATVLMIGISAGSALVARYMGEQGKSVDSDNSDTFCAGAVGICPGYDIEVCMGRIHSRYDNMLLNSAKTFVQHEDPSVSIKDSISQSMQEWLDNNYVLAGYPTREAYYLHNNPMHAVPYIRHPTLIINTVDDPFCRIENVWDNKYILEDGRAPGAVICVTKTGSHCSFLECGLTCWSERAVYEFLDAVVAKRKDK